MNYVLKITSEYSKACSKMLLSSGDIHDKIIDVDEIFTRVKLFGTGNAVTMISSLSLNFSQSDE